MITTLIPLLAFAAQLVRVPADKTEPPVVATGNVWVLFTDKGIFREDQYQAAVDAIGNRAPEHLRSRRLRSEAKGFDFDDIPVSEDYIRQVRQLGGRLRATSDWLNAASFHLPAGAVEAVHSLPFVYAVRPVGRRSEREPAALLRIRPPRPFRTQQVDSAEAHNFYGASFEQAHMMGVPDLFFDGYFGSGVKLAIFDTGLKLNNSAMEHIRIHKQHDFLSGDQFNTARRVSGWIPGASEQLRYLGLVADPALTRLPDGSLLLAFAADSFSYGYTSPRRALFWSASNDNGITWTQPGIVELSARATNFSSSTLENLSIAAHDSASYLAFNHQNTHYRNPTDYKVYLGHFKGHDWQSRSVVGVGRQPHVLVVGDTLYLTYLRNDSTIIFNRADVSTPGASWTSIDSLVSDHPLTGPMTAAAGADVSIFAVTRETGRIAQYRSTDGGATFFLVQDLVQGDARDLTLGQSGNELVLLFKDTSEPPFTRLSMLYSDDMGRTWTALPRVTSNTISVGGVAGALGDGSLTLLYGTGGLLNRVESEDRGETWSSPMTLDTAGFCYLPLLAAGGAGTMAAWIKRGDDNTAWEQGDELVFAREQPDHGTRMASIICGWQKGAIVGISPGVELLVAKTELHKVSSGSYYEYDMEEDTYIEALEWAERMGADIVSTSLGYRDPYSGEDMDGKTAPISIAASLAAKRGLLVVTAMGNRDTFNYPWPTPYIVAPADADGVIAAGGVEKDLRPWRGGGTGPTADGRVKPDLVALSSIVTVVDPDSVNMLQGATGTSCATALIAGCCALLKEAHPEWSADSIKAALYATSSRSSPNCTLGYGVPRVDSAFAAFPPDPEARPIPEDRLTAFPNPYIPELAEHGQLHFALELNRPSPRPSIRIHTVSGALVDTIRLDGTLMGRPGKYDDPELLLRIGAVWDGLNMAGEPVAAGLYTAVLSTTFGQAVTKFTVVR
ncbi:MAG: S8 family serine peptidase [candidate division WOR-3 bacterium]|nr:MAG: S8 family serine peptidase [candidate division WOR-3 bacterium]